MTEALKQLEICSIKAGLPARVNYAFHAKAYVKVRGASL